MDFTYDEAHEAVRELAERIFGDRSTHERLKEIEAAATSDGLFDDRLWAELAQAGLLGIGLPEDVGGGGLGFLAVCLLAEALGRTAAYVPLVETLAYVGVALDRHGSADLRRRWLPMIASGELVATSALSELVGDLVVDGGTSPATTATQLENGRWRLEGTKACVPAGLRADLVVVPATVVGPGGERQGLTFFCVEGSAPGVVRTRQDGPALPEALLELRGVEVGDDAMLGGAGDGETVLSTITGHATAALCVQEAGVAAAALALTADYAKTREQFGKPIATFQAVGQRAADAYVDAEAIRLTAWQAAWRLAEGLPATAELATAKYWAAEGGQRVVHAAAHVHGGVGVDRDYPLHRFFLLTEQIELTLGGARDSLARLGRILASEPA